MKRPGSPSISQEEGRNFLTDRIRLEVDWQKTPQARGLLPPPVQKPALEEAVLILLPSREGWRIPPCDLVEAIARRQSHRRFRPEPLNLEELAFLLWSVQGVRLRLHEAAVLRTVPSAGCRHPFETYLAVFNVEGLSSGLYRYLPLEHALVLERETPDLESSVVAGAHGQRFAGEGAVTFVWTALPARTEWRYGEASYKVIAIDAGHVCQNLYLACEAIGAGTCAIAAYNQDLMDQLLGVDGDEEFVVYLAPVGKV
jgi:SagB-type dehydrogenase family enzyme